MRSRVSKTFAVILGSALGALTIHTEEARSDVGTYLSHPPLHRPVPVPQRPMAATPGYFVDPAAGDDGNKGTRLSPWRTINHALRNLSPGDTLYLRGGSYFENVYCAVKGRPNAPITIRSFPGELAVIDGGIPEFQIDPGKAWEPYPKGAEGELVSKRSYKNIRDVVGLFGDSNVGLQTYWYAMDMRATNEQMNPDDNLCFKPVWCGPGLWYDKDTGRIHARLAHTNVELPQDAGYQPVNYKGETDARKLPLVVAPFNSTPLYVDQAMHVRFQDLVIRGGGHITVKMVFGVDVEMDRCTVYCGTYGMWFKNTGPFKMTHCAVRGTMQPWGWRSDTALRSYDGRVYPPFVGGNKARPEMSGVQRKLEARVVRHLCRMTTHAVLVTEGSHEFQVFAHPQNHDWKIRNCEFTDGHDGVYLGGRNIDFHHNWVANMNDDGIYLSGPTPYANHNIFCHENLVSTVVTAFAMHGRGGPGGDIFVYRNIADQRGPIQYVRPGENRPQGYVSNGGMIFFGHGGAIHQENFNLYHNTCLVAVAHGFGPFAGGMTGPPPQGAARRVFNNIYLYYNSHYFTRRGKGYPRFRSRVRSADMLVDGNLHWHATAGLDAPKDLLDRLRSHPLSVNAREKLGQGWAAHSLVADPKFVRFEFSRQADNDYRLHKGSPAVNAGVPLPEEFPDPYRKADAGRPDIGAMPLGREPLRVGIDGRITAGSREGLGHFKRPQR